MECKYNVNQGVYRKFSNKRKRFHPNKNSEYSFYRIEFPVRFLSKFVPA